MAAQANPVLVLTRTASAAVRANRFVTLAGAEAGAGVNTLGVADSAAASGAVFPCSVLGTATAVAGDAVTKNASLKTDSEGRVIDWASSGAKVAIALEAATAAGQLIEVLLIPNCV